MDAADSGDVAEDTSDAAEDTSDAAAIDVSSDTLADVGGDAGASVGTYRCLPVVFQSGAMRRSMNASRSETLIEFVNAPAACMWARENRVPANGWGLAIVIYRSTYSTRLPLPLVPGTYPIPGLLDPGMNVFNQVGVVLVRLDEYCRTSLGSVNATGGRVTISTVTETGVTGSYDVTFADGDRLTGTFDVPECSLPSPRPARVCQDGLPVPDGGLPAVRPPPGYCAGDAGTGDAGRGDGGVCNAVANIGAAVTAVNVASAPPTATGGTIVNGTYVLTAVRAYTGPGGASGPATGTASTTMVITGAGTAAMRFETITETSEGRTIRSTMSVAYTSATTLTQTPICPSGFSMVYSYSATPTSLRLLLTGQPEPSIAFESEYTLR